MDRRLFAAIATFIFTLYLIYMYIQGMDVAFFEMVAERDAAVQALEQCRKGCVK
jgi:hypothetical protein